MNVRSAVLAVAVLSGVVQVEAGGQISVLGRGESRVFAQGRGGPARSAPLRGPLVSIGNGQITVGGRGGSTVHALGPHVAVTIDGKRAKIEELGVGMIVSLERRDGEGPVVGIKAEGPTIGGEVKAIDADQRTVTLAKRGDGPRGTPEQTFSFAPGVAVTLDGQPASASDLQPGASVALKLTVDKKTVLSITGSRGREEGPKTGDRGP
jgi:hypothetical protein